MGSSFWDSICCPPSRPPGQVWAANNRNGLWFPHKGQGPGTSEPTAAGNPAQKPSQTLPQEASQEAGTALRAVGTHPCHCHLCHPGSLLMSLKVGGWACISNRQVLSAPAPLPGTAEMEADSAAALPVTRGRPSQSHLLPRQYKPQLPVTHSKAAASSFGI